MSIFSLPPGDREHQEALARRERSHRVLAKFGLPVPADLPCFAPLSAVRVPALGEVIMRAAGLACLVHRSHLDMSEGRLGDLDEFMAENGIFGRLTDEEKRYYFSPALPDSADAAFYRWRIECCWVLLWALGQVDDLGYPDAVLNPDRLFHLFFSREFAEFQRSVRLRAVTQLLDTADLYFRYRAIARRTAEHLLPRGGVLDPNIVHLRYATLLWLLGRGGWEECHELAWSD